MTRRDWENAYLTNHLVDAHRDDPAFGYRFLSDELERLGERACERRVWRLCSEMAIWSSFVKKSRSGKKPGPPVHDDLVQRDFSGQFDKRAVVHGLDRAPDERGQALPLQHSKTRSRVASWATRSASEMTADLAVSALRNAIRLRDPKGTIVHATEDLNFDPTPFVRTLKNNGLVGSMGRVAAAGDNAAMESFHALLQKNVLNSQRSGRSREELRLAIVTWIERTYHRRRRKRRLGKMTPVEFEALAEALDDCARRGLKLWKATVN